MSELIIMHGKLGDDRKEWSPEDKGSLEEVKRVFKAKLEAGWAAFRMHDKNKRDGDQITEFDEKAKSILLVPPISGG